MKKYIEKFEKLFQERNFISKSFCLLLSIILWAYLANTKTGELKFKIPIVTKHLKDNMVVSNISDKSIIAIFEGKKDYLKTINIKNIQAYVNLDNARVNKTHKYPIEMIKNEIPVSIKVRFLKKFVKIKVERKISKRIKVIPIVSGKVKEGYIMGKIKVEPQYITITGAGSLINKFNEIYTDKLTIDNRSENINQKIDLIKQKNVDITFSETNVSVLIPIINYGNLQDLDLTLIIRNGDENYSYIPNESSVKAYIKYSEEKIDKSNVIAYIDTGAVNLKKKFKNRNIIKMEFKVKIDASKIKGETEIVSVAPEKITVTISKKE